MGATTYVLNAKGINVKELFSNLVDEAIYDYGNDSYNGTISTTQLGRQITLPKMSKKKLSDFVYDDKNDKLLFPEKWMTNYADLGVSHYKAFTPQWNDDLQTPKKEKGVTTIQVFSMTLKGDTHIKQRFNSLSEAKKSAKQYSLLMEKDITIHKHKSNGTKFILGHFELTSDGKEYKSARKAQNKKYLPIHEYMFFVYAAC